MSELRTVSVNANMDAGFAISGVMDGHTVVIDQPVAAKGTGLGPTPLQMLLFTVGACIGTIGRIAAFQQKITLRSMQVKVDGDYNPAGLLGKTTDDRVGFTEIRISAVIDADLTDEQKQQFLDEICQRCPLHDNLTHSTIVVHSLA
ncbi:OsmC family protein [Alishewanella sp. 16-MA]|uniref:OsmC family protein n=1 Tax=Alishewanella maricola TaxID=2795740 RepID=A0ABS8C478_9ALTE|nr:MULTISPECIES: OsmC family protein [Alishewanella]MDP5036711.1 OsmC family protein [Alishewanella sp.]MDP5207909.1 OsmC family protein [Alishewanella sp. SMS9]MCB5226805.1 OsmC family protein [Alishewanella maricola]MDP5187748.1 OsmC family protein [Alishewanella sp.]MDP5458071.1 OsmC family protein [Alishewanella sp. SMS8]